MTDVRGSEAPQSDRDALSVEARKGATGLDDASSFQQQLQQIFKHGEQQMHQGLSNGQQQMQNFGGQNNAHVHRSEPKSASSEAMSPLSPQQQINGGSRSPSAAAVWKILPGKLGNSFRRRPSTVIQAGLQQQQQQDAGKNRRDAIESLLSTLSIEEESGTLCVLLDGNMLGTVEDSEFVRLKWSRIETGSNSPMSASSRSSNPSNSSGIKRPKSPGPPKKLVSSSVGFYQPTALDFGCIVKVEAWPTFSRSKRFSAQIGPLRPSAHLEEEVTSAFENETVSWAASIGEEESNPEPDALYLTMDPHTKQIERIDVLDVFTYEAGEIAQLRVILDDQHPHKLRLSKVLQQEDRDGEYIDLTLNGDPDARKVFVLGLLRHLPNADVCMASEFNSAAVSDVDAATSGDESDVTEDEDTTTSTGVMNNTGRNFFFRPSLQRAIASDPSDDRDQLSAEISRLDRESAYKDALIRDLREQVDELKTNAQRANIRSVAETGKSLAHVSDLEKEVERLRCQLDDAKTTIDSLAAREAGARAEIGSYKECLNESSQAREAVSLELAEEKQRTATLEAHLAESRLIEKQQQARIRELEIMARDTEQQAFDLQSSLQAQISLRVEAEAETRALQERLEVTVAQRKALRAKFESLAKDVSKIVQQAGLDSFMDMEEFIGEMDTLRSRLHSREMEKMDLLSENASLRAAIYQRPSSANSNSSGSSGASRGPAGFMFSRKPAPPARNIVKEGLTKHIGPAMGSNDASEVSLPPNLDLSKISLNRADRRQLALVYQLANSLTEQLTEKEDHLEQQRFANRKLAERVRELEIEATRWRR